MQLRSRSKTLTLSTPQIMAILNATPDSFSDGGKHQSIENALKFAENALKNGATMLDIGGESTRPGAKVVNADEELSRVIPVIEAIRARFDCWISIDTSKALVMKEAVNAGADLINDVRALQECDALSTAASLQVPICLMHMQGKPSTMQASPSYQNLFSEIDGFFQERIKACEQNGIDKKLLILDPGFGFGKTLEHNYHLLSNLAHFHHHSLPLLAGMSRKSMIYNLIDAPPTDILGGSVACACLAALQGAQIIRVHDVKETFHALQVINKLAALKGDNNDCA